MPHKKKKEETEGERKAREAAEARPRTTEQVRASNKGVPVEALRDPAKELKKDFQARQQAGGNIVTNQVTTEQIQQKAAEKNKLISDLETGLGTSIIPPEDPQAINKKEVIQAGFANVAPFAAGGAASGAAVGSVIPGAGTVGGAIIGTAIGSVGGFISGVRGNIKAQTSGQITGNTQSLRKLESNMRILVTDTNRNPANVAENAALFEEQLALIDKAHGQLFLETQRSVNLFSGNDGTPQLAKFKTFNSATREVLIREMQSAILNPNPNANFISTEEFQSEQ